MPEKRVPLSPRIRAPIRQQLDRLVDEMGRPYGIQQYIVEAALLSFFDTDPQRRIDWLQKVQSAAMTGGTDQIVREIRARQRDRGPSGPG